MTWSEIWATVIIGIIVVFVILILLVFLCFVLSRLAGGKKDNKTEEKKTVVQPAPKAEPVKSAPAPIAAPVVETGISGEVVAAISAAVACMMGSDKPFTVRSIKKRTRDARPAWNAAGIAENTRPF